MPAKVPFIEKLASSFQDEPGWVVQVQQRFADAKLENTTISTYLSLLRTSIIKRSFNGYVAPQFQDQIKALGNQFPQEALAWIQLPPDQKHKEWLLAKTERNLKLCTEDSFHWHLATLEFYPTVWPLLALERLFPGIKQRLEDHRRKRRKIKFQKENLLHVANGQALLDAVLAPLRSKESQPSRVILPALLLASGLRVTDIYHSATVQPVEFLTWFAHVTSKLKTGLATTKEDIIPLLCPFDNFVFHLQDFRQRYAQKPAGSSSGSRGKLNKLWCIEAVEPFCPNFKKPHQLRTLYAKFAYCLYGQQEHELTYIKKILLHNTDSAATAYSNIKLDQSQFILPFSISYTLDG